MLLGYSHYLFCLLNNDYYFGESKPLCFLKEATLSLLQITRSQPVRVMLVKAGKTIR